MVRRRKRASRLEVLHPDCAGIDIGKEHHYMAVDAELFADSVRKFGSVTRDLAAMAVWLKDCGVSLVAMESTSVYWIPVYEYLERSGFEVLLVPARMTRQGVLLLGLSRAEEGDLYRSVPVLDCSGQGSERYGSLVVLSQ